MKEQAQREPETVEEWTHHISEFASKCEFGTSEFQALSDFYNLARLADYTRGEDVSEFVAEGHLMHLSHEARLGVILQRIALLEHTIDQKSASVPGYAATYDELSISFQELRGAASAEAKTKYGDNQEQQASYVHSIYERMLDFISEDLFERHRQHL